VEYYNKLPVEPTVSVCLILDPMLATGGSAVATADILKRWGVKKIKFVGLIGAPEGIAAMQKAHPDIPIHLAAIDDHLNEHGYIVPGLGDAGDVSSGRVDEGVSFPSPLGNFGGTMWVFRSIASCLWVAFPVLLLQRQVVFRVCILSRILAVNTLIWNVMKHFVLHKYAVCIVKKRLCRP